jgi:hypothetical protein
MARSIRDQSRPAPIKVLNTPSFAQSSVAWWRKTSPIESHGSRCYTVRTMTSFFHIASVFFLTR